MAGHRRKRLPRGPRCLEENTRGSQAGPDALASLASLTSAGASDPKQYLLQQQPGPVALPQVPLAPRSALAGSHEYRKVQQSSFFRLLLCYYPIQHNIYRRRKEGQCLLLVKEGCVCCFIAHSS